MTDFPTLYDAIGAQLRALPAANYALTLNPADWAEFTAPNRGRCITAVPVGPGFPHFNAVPDPPPGERVGVMHGHNVYVHPDVEPGGFRIDPS
jgi:hypothetical protein